MTVGLYKSGKGRKVYVYDSVGSFVGKEKALVCAVQDLLGYEQKYSLWQVGRFGEYV